MAANPNTIIAASKWKEKQQSESPVSDCAKTAANPTKP